jgi:hypothetical protein
MKWLANFTYPALHFVDILRNYRNQPSILWTFCETTVTRRKFLAIVRNELKFSATGRQGYEMLRNMAVCYGWLWGLAN